MGWDSVDGLSIALLSTTTTPSKILSALTPSSTTCNSPPPFSHVKLSTNCFCIGGTCEPRRKSISLDKSPVIVDKLLSNFVIHDCMDDTLSITSACVLWEWSCKAWIDPTFFVISYRALLRAAFDCSNFCNLPMPLEASYHNLRNPNKKSNMELFDLWTMTISYIHLVPKTNRITSKIVYETFFRFLVYLDVRKINQLLCNLSDGRGLFLTRTLCNKSQDTFGWTMRLYVYMDRPLSDLK